MRDFARAGLLLVLTISQVSCASNPSVSSPRRAVPAVREVYVDAIATSAYGPFMCTAEIYFSDSHVAMVSRYIDFEMGALGAQPERPSGTPKKVSPV